MKPGYDWLLLRILEFVNVVVCADEILKFVGEHYLPMVDGWGVDLPGGSEKYGKLPSAVLRDYFLHGFHFSSVYEDQEIEIGPGMFIPNVTVICSKDFADEYYGWKGEYYLIVKVTSTQVKGILLKSICISNTSQNPIPSHAMFTYMHIYDGDGSVREIPARSYIHAGSMDTPMEDRMITKQLVQHREARAFARSQSFLNNWAYMW